MEISTADPLKGEHSAYVVAAHLDEPLLEQYFVMQFMGTYKLNRKLANRVLATQAVGNVFSMASRNKGPLLICCVIGRVSGQAYLSDVNLCLRKAVGLIDANAAVVAEGFRVAHEHRAADEYGLECLRRSLRRWGYTGRVYVRAEAGVADLGTPSEEPPVDKRFISRPDGSLRPSIVPSIAAMGRARATVKIKT